MEEIINTVTLHKILTILLIISSFWLLRSIFQREQKKIWMALSVLLSFGIIFFHVQQNGSKNMSLADMSKLIFPGPPTEYKYHINEGYKDGFPYMRYVFDDPKPEFSITMDSKTRYFRISSVSSINELLGHLELPQIASAVPELASITGSSYDVGYYYWEDYPLGTLLIERSLCRQKDQITTYFGVSNIVITQKK
ncbi:MAG: hypothetical protein JSV96_01250 [Candidatus Aminicenantes bacterium]|nr:MAG: hypothetical protein JSV96_01250 [Candidatus Aminicenantes bacterium]